MKAQALIRPKLRCSQRPGGMQGCPLIDANPREFNAQFAQLAPGASVSEFLFGFEKAGRPKLPRAEGAMKIAVL